MNGTISNNGENMADKDRMQCNKPVPSDRPGKKKMVKACEGGQEKLIHFGAKGYKHNYSDSAKRSFRARHHCDDKKSKLTPSYWACRNLWPKNKATTNPDAPKNTGK